jgi:hypothetical protein
MNGAIGADASLVPHQNLPTGGAIVRVKEGQEISNPLKGSVFHLITFFKGIIFLLAKVDKKTIRSRKRTNSFADGYGIIFAIYNNLNINYIYQIIH